MRQNRHSFERDWPQKLPRLMMLRNGHLFDLGAQSLQLVTALRTAAFTSSWAPEWVNPSLRMPTRNPFTFFTERLAVRLYPYLLLAKIGRMFSGNDLEDERDVTHVARHRTNMVEGGVDAL
jgi:hypothetical protein